MKKFTLTIKNNRTNEVAVEEQINAVLGGYSDEEMSGGFCTADGNALEIAQAIVKAKKCIADVVKGNPMLAFAVEMLEKFKGDDDDDE